MPEAKESPLPPRLYRFRTYGAKHADGKDKQSVIDLLRGRIRFSKITDFNDPFEGRPHAVPAFTDPGKQRNAVLKYAFNFYKGTGLTPANAHKRALAIVRGKTQQELVELMGERIIELCRMEGVYLCCLSDERALSNPLPWSHYADSHRGVAIHFSTTHPPFSFAFRIDYQKEYPEVVVPRDHQDRWEHVKRMFFTKSTDWLYEHELRIMKADGWAPGRDPKAAKLLVEWDGSTAVAHRNAVAGITIGAVMPEQEKAELLTILATEFPHLEVWQARLHRTKYQIVSERIR